MADRFRSRRLNWIVLWAYALSSVVLGHGVVLCEEPDGRTVVEIAVGHDRCLDHLGFTHADDAEAHAGPVECQELCCADCPCEDTRLTPEPAPVEKKLWATLPQPATVQTRLTGPPPVSLPTNDRPAVDRVTRRSLRSIVLLV